MTKEQLDRIRRARIVGDSTIYGWTQTGKTPKPIISLLLAWDEIARLEQENETLRRALDLASFRRD
jgi:hypothetical protein